MTKAKSSRWSSLEKMLKASAGMIRPSARMNVAQWAQKNRYLNTPGAYVGPWQNEMTPYLNEIMETLTSREHTGMAIVGPARSGKSDIFFNWLGYSVDCDPADIRIYLQTKVWAEDWSQGDLDKAFEARAPGQRQSIFKRNLLAGKHSNTLTRKRFISGMKLNLSWPAITELSGKTVPRLWLNDYDHMEQDVSKMGAPFWLAKKRATTFKRFGMCVAESTPGFEVSDPNWIAGSLHEAPPVSEGILKIYNQGDRRRWYWRCPECSESFEPSFDLFVYDMEAGSPAKIGNTVKMQCPCCEHKFGEDMRYKLNLGGKWLKDGQTWDRDGVVHGEGEANDIASFWLKGPAAFAQSWSGMVTEYLNAMQEYESTGSVSALKTNFELSQGEPFRMPRNQMARLPEELKSRAEDWGGGHEYDGRRPLVPAWVRFLVATIDVQSRSFVVQINGIGMDGEITLVDMFKIRKSNRVDQSDKRGEHATIDPPGYLEDWDLIISEVIERTYELADGSGRRMAIKITGCDSGGRAGTTTNAYNFWRRLRDDVENRGHHRRFHLIKGEPSKSAPRRHTTYPDSNRNDRNAGARGDVPVQLLNSNILKDQVFAILGRVEPPGAMIRFPTWAPNWVYKQLTTEERTAKGWENKGQSRNETFDLSYYALGICLHPDIRLEHINWEKPPAWAETWDKNILIIKPEAKHPLIQTSKPKFDLAKIAAEMA